MTRDLFILRGLPGSGKTTFGNLMGGVLCSADDFFENHETGSYKWTADKMHNAHTWCRLCVERAMIQDKERIVVANTHTQFKEFEKYIELAKEYNYRYFIITIENYNETTNVHNVPSEALDAMQKRFTIKLV